MISYDPLIQTLKERGMTRSDLRSYISSATIAKIANNEYLSLGTIDSLCRILHCRVENVIVYVEEQEKK